MSRILLILTICIIIAATFGVFSITPLDTFGLYLFYIGVLLIIFGGAMGAGGWYKAYNMAWMRTQKKAMKAEMETYHEDRREYTMYGFYIALAGILAVIIGLMVFFI